MNEAGITEHIQSRFEGVDVVQGHTGFDERSHVDRPGVLRLNIGVSKEAFDRLFGAAASTTSPSSTA